MSITYPSYVNKILQDAINQSQPNETPAENFNKQGLKAWQMRQSLYVDSLFDDFFRKLSNNPDLLHHKIGLQRLTRHLYLTALPFFQLGVNENPLHHHLSVMRDAFTIARHESQELPFVRCAVIAGLLHDVANGLVFAEKVKNSDIKKAINENYNSEDEKINTINALIEKGIRFRNAHMELGAEIAAIFLENVNSDQGDLKDVYVSQEEIDMVAELIRIHDNPSIAEYFKHGDKEYSKEHLIPLDNKLAVILREADRLWMVHPLGLEKDLFDDFRKYQAENIEKQPDPTEKLAHNVKRHWEEYCLYRDASKRHDSGINEDDIDQFINSSLCITNTGYRLFLDNVKDCVSTFDLNPDYFYEALRKDGVPKKFISRIRNYCKKSAKTDNFFARNMKFCNDTDIPF